MAAVAVAPLFMRGVKLTLKIGAASAVEYQCNVSEARVAVEPGDTVTVKTLCTDGSFSQPGKSSYSLVLTGIQDWSATGLAQYLWANEGATALFVLQAYGETTANAPATPSMNGSVVLIAGDYGGEIETYGELAVELPCVSKPTLLTA